MEQLPGLGREIANVVIPTRQIYAPLLLNNQENIRSTRCETFSYGPHERQKLDLYSPAAGATPVTTSNSILIFLYGGGLVRGEKSDQQYLDGLTYANLGHYFAENLGFPVAVVDYRLISHGAKFPSGGEDLRRALDWATKRYGTDLQLYLMGNSAGGVHVSTYLLAPDFAESRHHIVDASLRGVILVGVPFHFQQADPTRSETLEAYFGPNVPAKSPFGLLKAAKEDHSIENLRHVKLLALTGTLDPADEVLVPNADFEQEWRKCASVGSNLTAEVMNGHNHISPVLAVGTGISTEESWGKKVVNFIVDCSRR